MNTCKQCESLIPFGHVQCPNCNTNLGLANRLQGQVKKFLYGLSVTSISMTLMACYGGPPAKKVDFSGKTVKPINISDLKSTELK
jgi:hypothetical protein